MVFESLSSPLAELPAWMIVLSIWDIIWRAFAVLRSTKLNQPVWSVIFVIFQTAGILPILYLFIFSKIKPDKTEKIKKPALKKTKNSKKKN
ncbi:hypothetical protein J4462_03925 [Candidatus Pacearchaeota archaeon]|nr:hypothetical protein [Candidatus Pacearchaeota archaeon]